MTQPTVFISYSHRDEVWKDRLRPQLEVLELQDRIAIWDDRQIDPGGEWFEVIQEVMDRAAVAVCLISPHYLASNFCVKEEMPYLLQRRERDGMVIIPVLLRPCAWKAVPWLKAMQMLPRNGKAVSRDFQDEGDEVFAEVAERIFNIVDDPDFQPPVAPTPIWSPPEQVDITRLPMTGQELFGRQQELTRLDDAWDADVTHVVSLVAWGGVGKSTLVNKWLDALERDHYRGARRVYGWSFYSQGTGERVTSADQFIAEALHWFGDADPTAGSPWDKGQRLATLIQQEKTLLLLDGLEPLQSSLDYERGRIKDPALATLITELAHRNSGLCIITTREAVADLELFPETVRQEDLELISVEAGRALLRVGRVRGTDADLEAATRAFGHHALALHLLAVYLRDIPGHAVAHAEVIPDVDIPEEAGKHARRLLAAFERRFGEGPEVQLLRLLGLFDRPADCEELAALRAAPTIPRLTDHLHLLSEVEWLQLLDTLRDARLIAPRSRYQPDTLDAHHLVREHFGQQLQDAYRDAWREGHNRMYEYLIHATKEFPDTIEEMAPLYAAVVHGCQAGRYQETFDEVCWKRINRGDEAFSTRQFGAFGADFAAMSQFFDPPWSRPVADLAEAAQAFVLNAAGFCLRALGRLREAAGPMHAGLQSRIAQKDWMNAARSASNLSELSLTLGDIAQAQVYATQSVELANCSQDAFARMINQTVLAGALHQAGRQAEAEAAFREAEAMQRKDQPAYSLLYSVRGFQYCDLLLSQEQVEKARRRATQTLEWAKQSGGSLLDVALDCLTLGRALLHAYLHDGTTAIADATAHLNQAVNGFRRAGRQDYLPRGLLARAELHRVQGAFDPAQRDLDEAMTIATRGEMGLHQADAHLEYARLSLAMEDNAKARESLATAQAMITRMGYHRRDPEVAELERQL